MTTSQASEAAEQPRFLIVHAAHDAASAILLADALTSRGVSAVPLSRILASNRSFRTILTAWMLRMDAVVVLISPESPNDRVFDRSMSIASEFSPVIISSLTITAVRIGEVSIPSAVTSGFISATWAHFQSPDGPDSVALSVLRLIYLQPTTTAKTPTHRGNDTTDRRSPLQNWAPPPQREHLLVTPTPRPSAIALVLTNTGFALSILLAAISYAVMLVQRDLLADNWWQPAAVIVMLATLRAAAYATYPPSPVPRIQSDHRAAQQQPVGKADPASPHGAHESGSAPRSIADWGPKLAGIVGASAAVITGLVQAGSVASQHALASQKDSEAHQRTVSAEQAAHEKQLVDRANNYLAYALANDSYDRRLTLLSFLRAVPGDDKDKSSAQAPSDSAFYRGLRDWANQEKVRLEGERDKLLEILQSLIRDCEKTKDLCKFGGAHARSIVRIVQQVGPESLGADRARRVASLGIPIAEVSSTDTDLVGTAARIKPIVKGGIPTIIPGGPSDTPIDETPDGGQ